MNDGKTEKLCPVHLSVLLLFSLQNSFHINIEQIKLAISSLLSLVLDALLCFGALAAH